MKKSFFIVLEGTDCSGKTTLWNWLKEKILEVKEIKEYFGKNIIFTFEPGGTNSLAGEKIREIIFNPNLHLHPLTNALLFFASRSEHIDKLLKPSIEKGSLIICDRYYISTIVHQGFFDQISIDFLDIIMNKISQGIKPDICFFMDISEELFHEFYKKKIKCQVLNCLDEKYGEYKKIKDCYLKAIKLKENKGWNIKKIDPSFKEKNIEIIIDQIMKHIKK